MGIPPERLAAELLEQKFFRAAGLLLEKPGKEVARSSFERHFGTLEVASSSESNDTSKL